MPLTYVEISRVLTAPEALEFEAAGARREEIAIGRKLGPRPLKGDLLFRFPGPQYSNTGYRARFPQLREEVQTQFHRYLAVPTVLVKRRPHPFEPYDKVWDIKTHSLLLEFVRQSRYSGLDTKLDELVRRILGEPYRRASVFWEEELGFLRFVLEPPRDGQAVRKVLDFHLFRDLRIGTVAVSVGTVRPRNSFPKAQA
ncbi:MAG: hypothetical protein M1275_00450 [Patescibacteria group bacterium]|nr:hypothetical protein [Patescibacteria group bacterium]